MAQTKTDPIDVCDFLKEDLVSLEEACGLFPGHRIHLATAYRYVHRGLRGAKLEAIKSGGVLYTSTQAIQRFLQNTNR